MNGKPSKVEPIRIERKLVHGQWVDVKIYEMSYRPHDKNEAQPIHQTINVSAE